MPIRLALVPDADVCFTAPCKWITSGSTESDCLYHPRAVDPNPAFFDQFAVFIFMATTGMVASAGVTDPLMATIPRAISGAIMPLRGDGRLVLKLFCFNFILTIFKFVSLGSV